MEKIFTLLDVLDTFIKVIVVVVGQTRSNKKFKLKRFVPGFSQKGNKFTATQNSEKNKNVISKSFFGNKLRYLTEKFGKVNLF